MQEQIPYSETVSSSIVSEIRESYITKIIDSIFTELQRITDPEQLIKDMFYIHTRLFRRPPFQGLGMVKQMKAIKYCLYCNRGRFTIKKLSSHMNVSYLTAWKFIIYLESFGLVVRNKVHREHVFTWVNTSKKPVLQ